MNGYLLAIAAHGAAVHKALLTTFAGLVTDGRVSLNFSLQLARDPAAFHVLSWGSCPVLRTLDVERLIGGLVRFVGSHGNAPLGTLRTNFAAAVGNGRAVLVHREARERLVKDERSLRRRGFSVLESPWADIDLRTGDLVVTDPEISVDPLGLNDLRSMAPPARRPDAPVTAGRYAVSAVIVPGEAVGAVLGRADAGYQLVQRLASPIDDQGAMDMLDALDSFTEQVPVIAASTSEDARNLVLQHGPAAA